MKKQFLFLLTLMLPLSSCSRYPNTIKTFNQEAYNQDVVKYRGYDSYQEIDEKIDDCKINTYLVRDEDKFIYTIQIEYKDTYLSSLKAIMIPSTYHDESVILPCLGYSDDLNLASEKNQKLGEYPGFNLSYKTSNKDLKFYFFISYSSQEREEHIYKISSFTELGE